MPHSHLEAMQAIEPCRTEALGGHVYQGTDCGELAYRYHSGKHRHCPKCQNEEATRWLEKPRELLLPTPEFLVTSTLPDELRDVARSPQETIDTLLFQTSAAALQALALDPQYLGGQLGMVGVLQTWTREMAYHPHIHYLVPGGALSADGSTWLSPRYADWLVPVRALATIFRGQFKEALTQAGRVDHVPRRVWHKDWGVHCEPAGTGHAVITYLAPSIRRIVLTNNRLEKLEDGQVTFRVKDSTSGEWKHLTLPAEEFIRRFLQHVLPKGFIKVRYYGFLSPHCRESLEHRRRILAASPCDDPAPPPGKHRESQAPPPAPEQEPRCRKCGGQLVLVSRLSATTRAPP
jgi:Putative transposase/Transposase zinc-binding domain